MLSLWLKIVVAVRTLDKVKIEDELDIFGFITWRKRIEPIYLTISNKI